MKNRSDQLVHELGKKIVSGEYLPGDTLPKVEKLGEMYGVSRTVVRESLKSLHTLGLVKSNQRTGTVVLPRTEWQWWSLDVMKWALEGEQNYDFLLQLSELRLAIEPMAAYLAAKRATNDDFIKLTKAFRNLEKSIGKEKEWMVADYRFHECILNASHNDLIIGTAKSLRKALLFSRKTTILKQSPPDPEYSSYHQEAFKRHEEIYLAIQNRDKDAAYQKMYELIQRVINILENEPATPSSGG